MILVADACPVIFLAKLNRLALIREVFPVRVLIPEAVSMELVQENIPLHERQRIDTFLQQCRVEPVPAPRLAVASLSLADLQLLALAVRHPKSRILTDDGVVRRVALAEGRPVIGTLGLMIRAVRGGIITPPDARRAVDELIRDHAMRISVALYQETMRHLQ